MTQGAGLTGGCQCGAVRYRLDAQPGWSSICHCRMCQKAGGAPFMAFGSVPQAAFAWTRGAPAIFASSDIAERGFCSACGTPLTYRMLGRAHLSVTLGSLDDPEAVRPSEQIGVESRLSWCESLPSLPASRSADWMAKYNLADAGSRQHPDNET